jgi:hypothetical protein
MKLNVSDFRNPQKIRCLGLEALVKKLRPVGMAYFIRQFEPGEGNYTGRIFSVEHFSRLFPVEHFLSSDSCRAFPVLRPNCSSLLFR